ncbi:integrase, catalytic region, zinc finger, CCHC-type containing protein [Tanacetum coccineum]|uniref:Integrase, catalytic region, zinc finger, CCHC-type containing protein n=1 Tax=Tanacetum coccineum TaxID=301880 RepID=A0ABQ5BU73_9ASTR
MSTLVEFMIVFGADNRPPILDKPQYESYKSRMELYIQGKDHGRIILNSVGNGPLVWPTIEQEDGIVRIKTYEELSDKEKLQGDCDIKATNIVLQGLPPDVYALVNHHKITKYIWDGVKLLMQGTSLSRQERKCKLYDEFDKFSHVKGFEVPTFLPGDNPIAFMNKSMAFLSAVFTPSYPSTNNQLRSSSNPRNKATIQDGLQGNASGLRGNTSGQAKVVKCYNCQGEGHMARQCTQPKRRRDATWFKEKVLLVQVRAEGKDCLEQLASATRARSWNTDGHSWHRTITPQCSISRLMIDAYDTLFRTMMIFSSQSGGALMDHCLLGCDSDVLSEVQYSDTCQNDMMNQSVHELQHSKLSSIDDYLDNKITSDSNIIPSSQLSGKERKQEIDLSKHVKEKESLSTTLNGFKPEFKERESKSIDKEIVLENKNKELENIVLKKDIDEIETINIELEHSVAKLLSENEKLHKEKEHLKKTYKELYDSIKPSLVHAKEQCDSLIANLNSKSMENADLKTQIQEKHSREHADILREIVESARALSPLDSNLDSACKYVQRFQEVLVYVRDTCPCLTRPSEKLVVVTPKNKDRKVRFVDPITSSSNTQKQVDFHKPKDSNQHLLHSTGVISSTGASGSKPTSNTKNNRILQSLSSNKTNNIEDQSRSVKYRKNKKTRAAKTKCVDLLTGSWGTNLYTLSIGDMMKSSLICLLSKASKIKSWLWHRRLSHLNFGTIDQLAKQGLVRGLPKLKFDKDHLCSAYLCGPLRVESINGKKYILVIIYDYSRFTWVKFLRSKDEAPEFIIKLLKMIEVYLNATVRNIRTDNGTEFVNQSLCSYYEDVSISHQTSVAHTPQQNVATACYTQNHSLVRLLYGKKPYELLHDRKPDLSYLHVFGALCYPTNNSEDLGKLKTKADVDFDELTAMASEQTSLGPAVNEMTPGTLSSGLVLQPPSSTPFVPPTRDDWDTLLQPLFDEYFCPPPCVNHPVPEVAAPVPTVSTESQSYVIPPGAEEANHDIKVAHMDNNPQFGIQIPEPSFEESSSHDVIPNNVQPVNQPPEHISKWTKDHPIDNVVSDPSRPFSTRHQLQTEALFCYFDAFLFFIERKSYKEALTESYWIEAMQEELNEFERLEV